jgi:hypothetical protein
MQLFQNPFFICKTVADACHKKTPNQFKKNLLGVKDVIPLWLPFIFLSY